MKARALIVALLAAGVALGLARVGTANESADLRSRGFAGLGYRDVVPGDVAAMGLPDTSGVVVTVVVPGSPAEHAGLAEGDVVLAIGENRVADASSLVAVLRTYYAGDEVALTLFRGGRRLTAPMTLAASRERSDEIDVEYTSFTNREGIRLRAVVTSPLGSAGERLPALMLVSALSSPRLVDAPGYSMMTELAHEISKSGFRVLRFELRGYGDSEGEDYRSTDLETEVDDNLDALGYLMGRDDVDPKRVFVMGHSTGGFVAATLAADRDLAGLVVSCTIGRTLYERMMETLRLQSELGGETAADTDREIADYLSLCVAVASEEPLSSISKRDPRLARFVNSNGRIMDDRTAEYWRQQLTLNLPEVYSAVEEPVLIVYAASDFLTQLACHERIRDVLAEAGNEDVVLAVIEDLDHAYAHAPDKAASLENYKTRAFEGNPAPIRLIGEWLSERAR